MSRRSKHKLERRRKTRRQLGGAGGSGSDWGAQAIDSVSAWIQAVNKTPAFISDETKDVKYKKENKDTMVNQHRIIIPESEANKNINKSYCPPNYGLIDYYNRYNY